ncbi:HAMP domain-containing sensor histidine kinase [Daejeonella sp.]|uniref:sensor histidine kinase n=1 Tax=Daejeonella sp. TaxID=2805397 RepID=UPI0026AB3149|nr:HAMP domain-containing sensor histidine kinase [Daejeonella sp.]HQT23862.1 HAMP domain-containing sensor histidine kinase [Daejeonella sp.]HQT58573.1 HAMP domain-containing sensor histidine kinase [Daejeonella sp.]
MNLTRIKEILNKLTGFNENISLEARIFHAICIISFFVLAISLPFNILYGLNELAILMGILQIITVIFYYLSRIHNKLKLSVTLFALTANGLFVANYYFSSGINGPGMLLFLLGIFLITVLAPSNQYAYWLALNILEVVTFILLEYHYPSLIEYRYSNLLMQYADIGSTYILTVLLIFLATNHIRKSYYLEKIASEQKAKDLKLANETKNKLLSILAHDLRSPLSSIQSYLEALAELKPEEIDRDSIEASLLNETKYTQQMLSNMLHWSKTQMGGVTVNLLPLNLKDAIMPTINLMQSIAIQKEISIEENINNSITVLADRDMLQLVIRNLLSNALKFTNPAGQININAKIEGNTSLITISDTGKGIPYEMQKDLFSVRVKSTFGTQNEKGVGLGLSLCKEFTELQNGTIRFESEPGKGTRFFISFKLASALS